MNDMKRIAAQFPWGTFARATSIWMVLLVAASVAAETNLAEVAEKKTTAELSVPPLDHVEYPADRPKWLDQLPSFGSDVDSIVVISDPAETIEAAAEELRWLQRAAIGNYVSQTLESSDRFDVYSPDDETIDHDLVARQYSGVVTIGNETFYEVAAELKFDSKQKEKIQDAWKNAEVEQRLKAFGGLASFGLVILMCTSGLIGIASRRFPKS
jgi:hypothetical protein